MNGANRLASLDGWRAVAILLVLGSHSVFSAGFPPALGHGVARVFDGVLGVRFFFTISGFLITWLLVKEEQAAGFVSLKNFYVRRALRILPVYLACLMVTAMLQMAGTVHQSGFVWVQLFTFTRNFHQAGHLDYPVSGHFWSLAVEEQFYCVWPFIFLWLRRSVKKRLWFLVVMILFSIGCKCVALLGCYNRHLYFLFQENSTFLSLDCLAYGCAGAILLHDGEARLRYFFRRFATGIFLGACLLMVLPEIVGLGIGLQAIAFAVLLLQSVLQPEFKPFRPLNHRWMERIGVLSYSLYVWQQLILFFWPAPKLWFMALPAAFGVAWLSYHFLEKPFFSLRAKYRPLKTRREAKPSPEPLAPG